MSPQVMDSLGAEASGQDASGPFISRWDRGKAADPSGQPSPRRQPYGAAPVQLPGTGAADAASPPHAAPQRPSTRSPRQSSASSPSQPLARGAGGSAPGPPAPRPGCLAALRAAAKKLKREVLAIYYAMRHPRCPALPRVLAALVLAYALSPLDLIPDFIPVLGILDDLLLLPLLLWAAIAFIPPEVMEEARRRAEQQPLRLARNWGTATAIFLMWLGCLEWLTWFLVRRYGTPPMQPYLPHGMLGMAAVLCAAFALWLRGAVRKEERKARKAQAEALRRERAQASRIDRDLSEGSRYSLSEAFGDSTMDDLGRPLLSGVGDEERGEAAAATAAAEDEGVRVGIEVEVGEEAVVEGEEAAGGQGGSHEAGCRGGREDGAAGSGAGSGAAVGGGAGTGEDAA